jgi:hypothetical protein
MPIETALLAERSQDGESEARIEPAQGRMPGASVRRDGMGHPGPLGVMPKHPEWSLFSSL